MAAAYQSISSIAQIGGSTLVATKPSGTTTGDVLVCGLLADDGAYSASPLPTNFTQIAGRDGGNATGTHIRVGYLLAGGSEPASYSAAVTGPITGRVMFVVRVNGADGPTVYPDPTLTSGAGTTSVCPTLTPTQTSGLLLCFYGNVLANETGVAMTWTPPSGMTERGDSQASPYMAAGVSSLALASASATGTKTATSSAAGSDGYRVGASVFIPTSGLRTDLLTFGMLLN